MTDSGITDKRDFTMKMPSSPRFLLGLTLGASVASADVDPQLITGINELGIDLYHQLRETSDAPNLIISPLSIALTLGMVLPGASEETAREIQKVMGMDGSESTGPLLGHLQAAIEARNKEDGITLSIANRGFVQDGFPLYQDFVDNLDHWYGSGMASVDYEEDPAAAREFINNWVAENTNDLIEELLEEGVITSDTRLTLVNTIYLLADWAQAFDEELTSDEVFHFEDGSHQVVPTMRDIFDVLAGSGPGYRAVELPYRGDDLSLLIIVPDDLSAFEEDLDAERLDEILSGLRQQSVELYLPRLETSFNTSLNTSLQASGAPSMFCGPCNPLTGIADVPPPFSLVVTDVVHETYLRMDESGTEAAAATGVVIGLTSISTPLELRVDRSYLLALRDRVTGALLFMGRVMDPR